jgi:hypothetical protein
MAEKKRKGKYYRPPDGRLTSTRIRTWVRVLLKELDRTPSKLTTKERFRLFCKLEELQKELAQLEIEKTREQIAALKRAERPEAAAN